MCWIKRSTDVISYWVIKNVYYFPIYGVALVFSVRITTISITKLIHGIRALYVNTSKNRWQHDHYVFDLENGDVFICFVNAIETVLGMISISVMWMFGEHFGRTPNCYSGLWWSRPHGTALAGHVGCPISGRRKKMHAVWRLKTYLPVSASAFD